MKPMNYETFLHRVAMEFNGYLPKGLEQYHMLIKADKKGDERDVYLTIERDQVEYIRSIEIYPYYLNYLYGVKFESLLVEMVEELIAPEEKKPIEEKKEPSKSQFSLLAFGGVVICTIAKMIEIKKRRKREK